ncbi:hypothetical protein N6L26_07615 [Qipengyuania sp. SS22]|uniref:hypothetical protein n=1 Tax=Qipengyuania sp. SS22 TaxID=2979461 RepID=UPI0021E5C8E7|nr:hypothetical protein [Qipengyuania sp. SS22]UYH53940.1 hypothetical protein N6L26_07615 [Qipengyuania sp. SS22]
MALAAALPALVHAQSVNDFTLEPAPSPTATSQAQGPADTQSGVEIRPRAVNTPTRAPSPAITPSPTPAATTPAPQPSATTPALRSSPAGTPRAAETGSPETQVPATGPTTAASDAPAPGAPATPTPSPTPLPMPQAPAPVEEPAQEWPWLPIGGAIMLALLAVAGFAWRRRSAAAVPQIERPTVGTAAPSGPVPMSAVLAVQVENDKLIRSAAFATLKYRMTLVNRTDAALTDVAVGLDLVSAHAGAPMEDQVATIATALDQRHAIARISPRQSVTLEGQVQLALAGAHVIRQGRYPLLVPLLRVRIDGPGEGALLKTYVVGQGTPGSGRVQPFRLDEGPRSYAPIAQRELA